MHETLADHRVLICSRISAYEVERTYWKNTIERYFENYCYEQYSNKKDYKKNHATSFAREMISAGACPML